MSGRTKITWLWDERANRHAIPDETGTAIKTWRRGVMFCVVGALGIAVQLLTLGLLIQWLGLHYLVATALAVEAAVLHNFIWHERWTWADRKVSGHHAIYRRLALFHLANGVVSIIGNLLWMRLLAGAMGWNYLPANMTTIAAGALLNFWAGDRLVFRGLPSGLARDVIRDTTPGPEIAPEIVTRTRPGA